MNQLHKSLSKKYEWYATWHTIPYVSIVNFVILIGVGSFTAQAIIDVGKGEPEGDLRQAQVAQVAASLPACKKVSSDWVATSAWPVSSLRIGDRVYTQAQLVSLLKNYKDTDASVLLARQLVPEIGRAHV